MTAYKRGYAACGLGHDLDDRQNESWQAGWLTCYEEMSDESEEDDE